MQRTLLITLPSRTRDIWPFSLESAHKQRLNGLWNIETGVVKPRATCMKCGFARRTFAILTFWNCSRARRKFWILRNSTKNRRQNNFSSERSGGIRTNESWTRALCNLISWNRSEQEASLRSNFNQILRFAICFVIVLFGDGFYVFSLAHKSGASRVIKIVFRF